MGPHPTMASDPVCKLWLRAEVKEGERRAALTPGVVKTLVEAGVLVTVEEGAGTRCFKDEDYSAVGAVLTSDNWTAAPADYKIVGLKELPDGEYPLTHDHIFFAHCFKGQEGAEDLLARFVAGNGRLFDLEYLVDDKSRRVAAFGKAAGFAGMASGILAWCHQQLTL